MHTRTNTPKRVLFTQLPTGGGSSVSLLQLMKGMDDVEYEPCVLFLQANNYRDRFEALGIEIFDFNLSHYEGNKRRRKQSPWGKLAQLLTDARLALRIAHLLKRERIDIVHQNLGFDRAVMLAAWLTGTRQVCHFRSFSGAMPRLIKLLSSRVDATLFTTEAIARHYREHGIAIGHSAVVYEPIGVEGLAGSAAKSAARAALSIAPGEILVCNIGRITPWKGQHYFLDAIAPLIGQYPQLKVWLVGQPGNNKADQDYDAALRAHADDPALKGQVTLAGNRDDVADIMAAADIVVHSACQPEPFGLVIAEAMATGTAVVATRGGGTPEIITDGRDGLLVPMAEADAMGEAIRQLLEAPARREALGTEAASTVARRFSIRNHVDRVVAIYRELPDTPASH